MNAIVEQAAQEGIKLFGVTENICCEVSTYQGKTKVDLRKWFQAENKMFFRTKMGIKMTKDEWDDFIVQIGEIDKFVQEQFD
ncbi:MAG: transcriptional coactivator p15/PC4 family protein [Candidatus Heimdallarchaeaceae archaeon]